VTTQKKRILDCLNNQKLSEIITLNPLETYLHVISIGSLDIKVKIRRKKNANNDCSFK
jgi:hypothetical protein